jgi:hypothetical protein
VGNNAQFRMKTPKEDYTSISRHREDNNIQRDFGN